MSITTTDLVALDVDAGGGREAVIGLLADRLAAAGRTTDRAGLVAAAMAREAQSAPDCPAASPSRTAAPPTSTTPPSASPGCRPGRLRRPDGPADLAFLIAAPESGGSEH